jgi:hypothetical protein
VREQVSRLEQACSEIGRDPSGIDRILLTGFTPDRPLDSVDAFVDTARAYQDAGITEIVVHWPIPDTEFAADPEVFERIIREAAPQLA